MQEALTPIPTLPLTGGGRLHDRRHFLPPERGEVRRGVLRVQEADHA